MGLIQPRRHRQSLPPGIPTIDRARAPRGTNLCVLPGLSGLDLVSGRLGSPRSAGQNYPYQPSPAGTGIGLYYTNFTFTNYAETASASFIAWLYAPPSPQSISTVFAISGSAILSIDASGHLSMEWYNGSGYLTVTTINALSQGFHSVAVTAGANLRVYVDGMLWGSAAASNLQTFYHTITVGASGAGMAKLVLLGFTATTTELTGAEVTDQAADPFQFLIFPDDRLRAMSQLASVSGGGVYNLAITYLLSSESLTGRAANAGTVAETAARNLASPGPVLEAGTASAAAAPLAVGAAAAMIWAGRLGAESVARASEFIVLADEWGGAALVAAASQGAFEIGVYERAITPAGVETGTVAVAAVTAAGELSLSARLLLLLADEAVAGTIGGAAMPADWTSALTLLAATSALPVEALAAAVCSDATVVEWSGTVTRISAAAALPVEWRITAAAPAAAAIVAIAAPRRRIATAAARLRFVTFMASPTMSQARDLFPAQDALVEGERIGFDFGPALGAGVTITAVASIICAVYSGADFAPATHVLGLPQIVASAATGALAAQVDQVFGGLLAGVTYRLQCVVLTSDGQTLSLWAHLPSRAPN